MKMDKLEILKALLDTNTKIIEMEKKIEKMKIDAESFYERHNIALTDLIIDTLVDLQLAYDGTNGWRRDTKDYRHKPCLLIIFDMMLECEMPVEGEYDRRHRPICKPINEETLENSDMNKLNWEEYKKYETDNQYDYITPVISYMLSIKQLYNGHLFPEALYKAERYFYNVYKIEKEKLYEGGNDIIKDQLKLLKDFKEALTSELEKAS
jgi:hypothetical protein